MKRTNAPNTKSKKPVKSGPESGCTPEVIQETYGLAMLGLTNKQLAMHFGVSQETIQYWSRTNPEFHQALHKGRTESSIAVVESLYARAIGYEHDSVKFFKDTVTEKEFDEEGNIIKERSYGRIIKQPYRKKYPPDVKAAIKILAVRDREYWGEAYKVEHRHKHLHAADIHIHQVLEQISDKNTFTDDELKTLVKLGLQQDLKQLTNGNGTSQ